MGQKPGSDPKVAWTCPVLLRHSISRRMKGPPITTIIPEFVENTTNTAKHSNTIIHTGHAVKTERREQGQRIDINRGENYFLQKKKKMKKRLGQKAMTKYKSLIQIAGIYATPNR